MEFNATFIVSIISFILFTLIMNKILYKPIDKIMTERQEFINETLSAAKNSINKADALLKDRNAKLESAKASSKEIITRSTVDANLQAEMQKQEAKSKSIEYISSAKNKLHEEAEILNKKLSENIDDFAKEIATKIMGEV